LCSFPLESKPCSTGARVFPVEYFEVSLNGLSAKIPCMNTTSTYNIVKNQVLLPNLLSIAEDMPTELRCPEPLVFDSAKGYCAVPCPDPIYTAEEYALSNLIFGVISSISLAGAGNYNLFFPTAIFLTQKQAFVVLSYAINPKLRRMPGVIVLWLSLYVLIFLISNGMLDNTSLVSPDILSQ